MAQFREGVEIIHRMWMEDYPAFTGKYYTIDKPINEPKGVRQPHIPLWIGGGGEQVTLKLVARFGDACNIGGGAENVQRKLGILKGHCGTVGTTMRSSSRPTSRFSCSIAEAILRRRQRRRGGRDLRGVREGDDRRHAGAGAGAAAGARGCRR